MGLVTQRRGFTVIELLIVVLIVGIISMTGFPVMMQFIQQVRLEQEARNFVHDLELLRLATITAGEGGTGSGAISLCFDNDDPTRRPIVGYVLYDPATAPASALDPRYLRPAMMESAPLFPALSRHLADHSVCLQAVTPDPLPSDPNHVSRAQLRFNRWGLLDNVSGDVRLRLSYFEPRLGQIQTAVGTWTVLISSGTGRISLLNESAY